MENRYWFKHDLNARNDPKLQLIWSKLGLEGIGLYWCIVEKLYESKGIIMRSHCDGIAFEMRVDSEKLKTVLNSDLFEHDDKKFWSKRVLDRISSIERISEIQRNNANKRWGGNAAAMPAHSGGNAAAMLDQIRSDQDQKRSEKKKEKKRSEGKQKHSFAQSPFFEIEKLKEKIPEWSEAKIKHYHQIAKDGSEAKGYLYLDWAAAIRNWARMDEQRGHGFKEPEKPRGSNMIKFPEDTASPAERAAALKKFQEDTAKLTGKMKM